MSIGTAGDAFLQMVLHDERASLGQFLLMKSGEESTNIGAATDRLQRAGCGVLAQASLELLPHVLGGRGESLGVGLFGAKLGNRLIQRIVLL